MIRTERLLLRRAEPGDVAAFHDIMRRPEAMAYWSTPPHPDLATTEAWLARSLDRDTAQSAEFAVVHQGRVIGEVGGGTLPEVGYIFHPDYWGMGLATEAMRAMIAFVFANYPVDHLMADVDPRNTASVRLLSRLGFAYTHHADNTFCIDGTWVHSDYYRRDR